MLSVSWDRRRTDKDIRIKHNEKLLFPLNFLKSTCKSIFQLWKAMMSCETSGSTLAKGPEAALRFPGPASSIKQSSCMTEPQLTSQSFYIWDDWYKSDEKLRHWPQTPDGNACFQIHSLSLIQFTLAPLILMKSWKKYILSLRIRFLVTFGVLHPPGFWKLLNILLVSCFMSFQERRDKS